MLAVSLPPGSGKTTLAIFYLTWLGGKIPNDPMLTGSQDYYITASAARNHVRNAERRFREHTAYHRIEQRNLAPLPLDLTRGEGKIILSALQLLERDMMKSAVYNVKSDWKGRLPYEARIASDLYRKFNVALYGEDHKFYDLFVGAFSDEAPADTDFE